MLADRLDASKVSTGSHDKERAPHGQAAYEVTVPARREQGDIELRFRVHYRHCPCEWRSKRYRVRPPRWIPVVTTSI